jgi:pantothenate kinase-related protein Tda10
LRLLLLPNLSSKASTSLGAPQPKPKIPIARCSFVCSACVIENLIAKVIADFQSSPNQNRIVGISGIDGSGKSTLSTQLEQAVASNDIPVAVINFDD